MLFCMLVIPREDEPFTSSDSITKEVHSLLPSSFVPCRPSIPEWGLTDVGRRLPVGGASGGSSVEGDLEGSAA